VEVLMTEWVARYEEGYVTAAGESVTIADELHTQHPWRSPDDATDHWSRREDLAGSDTHVLRNGLEQTHDVSGRPEFTVLSVVSIWRRVTFATV
jgi:hypothetical protein